MKEETANKIKSVLKTILQYTSLAIQWIGKALLWLGVFIVGVLGNLIKKN